ncbi:hypothetical protein [Streptomyces sp. WG-D5]
MTEAAKSEQPVQSTKAKAAASKATADSAKAAKTAASKSTDDAAQGAGQVVTLASRAKAGGEFLTTVPAKSAQAATAAWGFVKHRKAIAAGTTVGLLAALAGTYGLGRASARRGHGPITRATGGRF